MTPLDTEQLYRRYGPMVLRRILRFVEPSDAEEVLHEVFVKVMEQAESFRGDCAPGSWIWQIATRHCINRLRDQNRRRALLQEHGPGWTPADIDCGPEMRAIARQCCEKLPDDLMEIAMLHFVDELTQDEIARRVGFSRRTVGHRIASIRELGLTLREEPS